MEKNRKNNKKGDKSEGTGSRVQNIKEPLKREKKGKVREDKSNRERIEKRETEKVKRAEFRKMKAFMGDRIRMCRITQTWRIQWYESARNRSKT